jgi:hypothetical protein
MMHHVGGSPLGHGHVEGIEHQLGAEMRRHRPADHATTPRIEDNGADRGSLQCRDVDDIRHPEPIRPAAAKAQLARSGAGGGGRNAARGARALSPAHTLHPDGAHEPGHALAPYVDAGGGQLGGHAGHAWARAYESPESGWALQEPVLTS